MVSAVSEPVPAGPGFLSARADTSIRGVGASLCLVDVEDGAHALRRAGVGGEWVRQSPEAWETWRGRPREKPVWFDAFVATGASRSHDLSETGWAEGLGSAEEVESLHRAKSGVVVSVPLTGPGLPVGMVTLLTAAASERGLSTIETAARTLAAALAMDLARAEEPTPEQVREAALAALASDLRNPLHATYAGSQILTRMPLSPSQERRHIRMIESASARMSRILDDALALARLQNRGPGNARRATTIRDVVRVALDETEALRRTSEVSFDGLDGWVPDYPIRADARGIGRALSGLLRHVIERAAPGTRVRVQYTRNQRSSSVVLFVPGMDPGADDPADLFEWTWFPTQDRRNGSLPLALASRLTAAVHGAVGCAKAEGGSELWLEVPNAPSTPTGR